MQKWYQFGKRQSSTPSNSSAALVARAIRKKIQYFSFGSGNPDAAACIKTDVAQ